MHLRKLNPSLASNSFPHSEHIPIFYKQCILTFDKLFGITPDILFTLYTKMLFKILLSGEAISPKIERLCPSISFTPIWRNMHSPCIDPDVRNTFWRLCHDVIYVNYYLFEKHISNNKLCPFCNKIETVRYLFLECSLVSPLNKIVLFLLRRISRNQICLSEKTFRYFVLPSLGKYEKQLALIILSESRHIIWTCRNLAKHEIKSVTAFQMVAKFLNKLKMRIYIHRERMPLEVFIDTWCSFGFCSLPLVENKITFNPQIDIDYYMKKQVIPT